MDYSDRMKWLELARELQSIAQAGLTYTRDPYDRQRYARLLTLTAEFVADHADRDAREVREILELERGYLTPKVDVRAVVMRDDRVLLVRERADGRWSLPGGWADPGEGPGQIAARETREETGYHVRPTRLLAVYDKTQPRHGHPPDLWSVYKMFVACELIGGSPGASLETLECGFFGVDALPPLSTTRNTESQVRRVVALTFDASRQADFD